MNINKAITSAFNRAREKNWEYVVFLVDIHDTIFKASFGGPENYEYLGKAKEALQLMTSRKDVRMILWSSTYIDKLADYMYKMSDDYIYFDAVNKNIEGIENTDIAYFDEKPFFSVGIDNAFGFEAETDWEEVIKSLNQNKL